MGFFAVLATTALAVSTALAATCTPQMRVNYSKQVGIGKLTMGPQRNSTNEASYLGYNAVGLGASKKAFDLVRLVNPPFALATVLTLIA